MQNNNKTVTQTEYGKIIAGSLLIIATIAFTIALKYTAAVLIPFVLALFIYYLILPLITLLNVRLKFPRWLATLVSLVIIVLTFSILIPFLSTSIITFINSAKIYQAKVVGVFEYFLSVLNSFNLNIGQDLIIESIQNFPVLKWIQSIVGNAAGILSTTLLVFIFLLFLLMTGKNNEEKKGIWIQIDLKIRRYLITKVITSASTGILVGLILWILGLELAIVFGVFAFFLNFIPTVGSIISTLLPLPIAFLQFTSPFMILAVLIGPLIVQIAIGNVIEPLIMGDSLDLHPAVILLSLIFWGLIWGVTGMLLAAPITAILKIVCDRFSITQPIAELLAGRLPFTQK